MSLRTVLRSSLAEAKELGLVQDTSPAPTPAPRLGPQKAVRGRPILHLDDVVRKGFLTPWEGERNSICEACLHGGSLQAQALCSSGGALLECAFCHLVFHDTEECLGGARHRVPKSAQGALWACPVCWRHGFTQLLVAKRILHRWTAGHQSTCSTCGEENLEGGAVALQAPSPAGAGSSVSAGYTIAHCDCCDLAYHNVPACLGSFTRASGLRPGAEWACPSCWNDVQRHFIPNWKGAQELCLEGPSGSTVPGTPPPTATSAKDPQKRQREVADVGKGCRALPSRRVLREKAVCPLADGRVPDSVLQTIGSLLLDSALSSLSVVCSQLYHWVRGSLGKDPAVTHTMGGTVSLADPFSIEFRLDLRNAGPAAPKEGELWSHEHNHRCETCGIGGDLLCCDFCNLVYHLGCLSPPLAAVPDSDTWACPSCASDRRGPVMGAAHVEVLPTSSLPAHVTTRIALERDALPHSCLVVFGGYHSLSFRPNTSLYVLPLADERKVPSDAGLPSRRGSTTEEQWVQLASSGSKPPFAFGTDQAFTLPGRRFATFPWVNGSRSDKQTGNSMVGFHSLHVVAMDEGGATQWTQRRLRGDYPSPRIGFATDVARQASGWKLYLFGGQVHGNSATEDLYVLDLATLAWALLEPRVDHANALSKKDLNETLHRRPARIVVGGGDAANAASTSGGRGVRGSEGCRGSRVPSPGPSVMTGHSLTALGAGRYLYLFGGLGYRFPNTLGSRSKLAHSNEVHEYDTVENRWHFLVCTGRAPARRHHHTACSVGPYLVVVGGCTSQTTFDDVSMLHTAHCVWSKVVMGPTGATPTSLAPSMRPCLATLLGGDLRKGDPTASHPRLLIFGGGPWKSMEFAFDSTEQNADLRIATVKRLKGT